MTCLWFNFLCRVVPFAGLRMRLCRRHVDRCRRCQQALESTDLLPQSLVTAEQIPTSLDLWPGIQTGIARLDTQQPVTETMTLTKRRSWQWIFATAASALLLAAGFWIISQEHHSDAQPGTAAIHPAVQTRLCSARIADRPARIFLIQSRNPDRTIFWIARNNKRS